MSAKARSGADCAARRFPDRDVVEFPPYPGLLQTLVVDELAEYRYRLDEVL